MLTADQLRHDLMTTHTRPREVTRDPATGQGTAVPLPVKVLVGGGVVLEVGSAAVEVVGGEKCYVLRCELFDIGVAMSPIFEGLHMLPLADSQVDRRSDVPLPGRVADDRVDAALLGGHGSPPADILIDHSTRYGIIPE